MNTNFQRTLDIYMSYSKTEGTISLLLSVLLMIFVVVAIVIAFGYRKRQDFYLFTVSIFVAILFSALGFICFTDGLKTILNAEYFALEKLLRYWR